MSIQDAILFCELLVDDDQLQSRAAAAVQANKGPATTAALVSLGFDEGLSFTEDELRAVGSRLVTGDELSAEELGAVAGGWGDSAQLANIDLQTMLQKQQQAYQMMSSISRRMNDTTSSIISNMK